MTQLLVPLVGSLFLTAAAPGQGPLALVPSADAEVEKVLSAGGATVEKLANRADDFIDFVELARRALGSDWDSLSKKQQQEFSATMKGVLRASYAQKVLSDGRGSAKVDYGEERIEGNEATVTTTIKVKEDTLPVVYRLFRAGTAAKWKIYDVITDEVSLVSTYNDQFRQVIAKKGFEGLLKSLKARKAQLEAMAKQ
jgi:phospholipid transport system substrate-binding protein